MRVFEERDLGLDGSGSTGWTDYDTWSGPLTISERNRKLRKENRRSTRDQPDIKGFPRSIASQYQDQDHLERHHEAQPARGHREQNYHRHSTVALPVPPSHTQHPTPDCRLPTNNLCPIRSRLPSLFFSGVDPHLLVLIDRTDQSIRSNRPYRERRSSSIYHHRPTSPEMTLIGGAGEARCRDRPKDGERRNSLERRWGLHGLWEERRCDCDYDCDYDKVEHERHFGITITGLIVTTPRPRLRPRSRP